MPTHVFTEGPDSFTVAEAGSFDLTFLGGDDFLTLRHADATTVASMGDGSDLVSHRGGTATVDGGAGSDRFDIYASGLTATGGADNDLFNIRGGVGLSLSGGLGNDRFNFYGASGDILLHGNDGDDDFFGYNMAISGEIHGGAGNDYFIQFRSGVSLHGGTGNDIYRADATSPATFIELTDEGRDSVQVARGATYVLPDNIENISVQGFSGSTSGSATLSGNELDNTINAHANVETIFGLGGDDRIAAKGGNDTAFGGVGNDYLDGGPGDDVLHGEAGNDTINGRTGNDQMIGGTGNDTYYVDSLLDIVTEALGEGTDLVRTATDYSLPANVENATVFGSAGLWIEGNLLANELTGGTGADILGGQGGNDTLRGGNGTDSLFGDSGEDILQGGAGNDSLFGGTDSDKLYGGDGTDVLDGGLGADQLRGDSGADSFQFTSAADSTSVATDLVVDFEAGADQFDLSLIDANQTLDGDQSFTLVEVPSGAAGELWVVDSGNGAYVLYGDVDGGGADLVVNFNLVGSGDILFDL